MNLNQYSLHDKSSKQVENKLTAKILLEDLLINLQSTCKKRVEKKGISLITTEMRLIVEKIRIK